MVEVDSNAGRYNSSNMAIFVNRATPDDRSFDILKSKRFSIGALGDYSDHFPATSLHGVGENGGMKVVVASSTEKALIENCQRGSLGFLNSSFIDDFAKINRRSSLATLTMNRRCSLASVGTFASEGMDQKDNENDDDDDSEISEVRCNQSSNLPPHFSLQLTVRCISSQHLMPAPRQAQSQPQPQQALLLLPWGPFHSKKSVPGLSASKMNQVMEAFCEAMAQSHKSQQAIHDWDRKMGLKRSHSKTMRQTMRSRKKIKSMLKKSK